MDSAFLFDSVTAMALGACEVRKELRDGNGYENDKFCYDFMNKILITDSLERVGIGNVTFDRSRRARDIGSVEFVITNVRPHKVGNERSASFSHAEGCTSCAYFCWRPSL